VASAICESVLRLLALGLALVATLAVAQDEPVDGQAIYSRDCLACHMADGRGVPGMNPPLTGSPWVSGPADSLAGFVLTGGFGPEILMARFDYLSDAELAALLMYIRAQFAGIDELISADSIAAVRSQLP
jgi:mono/diheme cytochrome c family protein